MGEVGQAKRGSGPRMASTGFSRQGLLHIHLGGCGVTVLIDSYKLHNNSLCRLSLNSVIIIYMYV